MTTNDRPTPSSSDAARSTATHCPTCAAPIREESSKFCAFCGTKLPEPETVVVQAWAPNAPERFEAASRHPSVAELLQRTPSSAPQVTGASCGVAALVLFCTLGLVITFAFARSGSGGLFVFMLLIMLIGLILLTLQVTKTTRLAPAQLERSIALVVDERIEVNGRKHARTSYYVTLEYDDRSRHEFEVQARLAGHVAPGDMGMAYVKSDVLLDFQRIDV